MELLIEILGWIGSIMLLTAYGLNSYQKINSNSLTFLLLNIIAGLFLVIYTLYKQAYANTFINVVWVIIAIPALYQLFKKSKP